MSKYQYIVTSDNPIDVKALQRNAGLLAFDPVNLHPANVAARDISSIDRLDVEGIFDGDEK